MPSGLSRAEWRGIEHAIEKGAEHGIADAIAPMNALMGVFLSDERPNRSKPPPSLDYRVDPGDIRSSSPQLKQVFFIGDGKTSSGTLRRYLVPAKATRLYLGVMDGYEWNNNSGSFTVTVAIERDRVDSGMFTVDSSITFNKWACLPDRAHCTPDRPIAEEKGAGPVPRNPARLLRVEHQCAGR